MSLTLAAALELLAPSTVWPIVLAATALLAGMVVYVSRLNLRLKHSKQILEAEVEVRRVTEERLAENEERLRQIIASEPECVKIQAADGLLLEMNPAGLSLVEAAAPEEIVGTTVYRVVAPEFRPAYQQLTERVFQGESAVLEFQIISLRGRRRWMETHAVPLRDARGQVTALLGITRDITARKLAEDQVRVHYRELAHTWRLTTLGEMASGLAHELNQPLAAIANYSRGCLHRLRAGNPSGEELTLALEQVCAQAGRAGDIIRGMRKLVNKGDSLARPMDLNAVVRDARVIFEPEAQQHRVRIQAHLAEGLPMVLADAIQVEQVILNIARNGMEAMVEAAVETRCLELRTWRESPDLVALSVSDTGPGVTPEMVPRLFEPFFTTKPDGMGMGLAICRTIIEAHGGTLLVLPNAASRGLTLRFFLPAAHAENP